MIRRLRNAPAALLLSLLLLAGLPSPAPAATLADAVAAIDRAEYGRALALLRPMAEKGHPAAQFHLANLHSLGQGVPVDQPRAAALYARASEAGHLGATRTLANMVLSGLGVPRDEARAVALLERAAAQAEQQAIEEESCD
ncbi:MAG: hypothetical protein R3298_08000 [Gammaproteobacteria bacterium]|nr:hypothetical protein [Gammaproteobacteria bacterium]